MGQDWQIWQGTSLNSVENLIKQGIGMLHPLTFGLKSMYVAGTYWQHALHTWNRCKVFFTGEYLVPLLFLNQIAYGYFVSLIWNKRDFLHNLTDLLAEMGPGNCAFSTPTSTLYGSGWLFLRRSGSTSA